jgi:hypothetical protein
VVALAGDPDQLAGAEGPTISGRRRQLESLEYFGGGASLPPFASIAMPTLDPESLDAKLMGLPGGWAAP